MWNVPTEKQLAKLPELYSTDEIAVQDKKIFMHFFIGGCDWYIAEFSQEYDLFFGYAILNGDHQMAEWGNISFAELKSLKVSFVEVDRDKYWKVKKASEIPKIYPNGVPVESPVAA